VGELIAHGRSIAFGRSQPGETPTVSAIIRISRMRINAYARAVIMVSRRLTIVRSLVEKPYRRIRRRRVSYHAAGTDVNKSGD
jgi:hypothetical protein